MGRKGSLHTDTHSFTRTHTYTHTLHNSNERNGLVMGFSRVLNDPVHLLHSLIRSALCQISESGPMSYRTTPTNSCLSTPEQVHNGIVPFHCSLLSLCKVQSNTTLSSPAQSSPVEYKIHTLL